MKKTLLITLIALAPLLPAEDKDWVTLYNGKDLTGWQTTGNWIPQKDGSLLIQPRKGEKGWQRYSAYLWSNKKYKDFVLHVEYKYPPKGNSGIHFRVGDLKNPVNTGIEAQVLDSFGKKKVGPHDHGGIIRTVGASKNMSRKPGQWNTMIVTCKGHHLKVQLNGEGIVDIQLDKTPMKDRPLEGHIGLQDHGEPNNLHFRNIKIKEL
ncbi:MAG: DUF1080 domain-containing protein [Verrucomicrobiota bacterium]|jgi:hypothetical protein|nr:DUF1080 domain-containing protein [Verrucomicrobiota bacterium]